MMVHWWVHWWVMVHWWVVGDGALVCMGLQSAGWWVGGYCVSIVDLLCRNDRVYKAPWGTVFRYSTQCSQPSAVNTLALNSLYSTHCL